MVKVDGGGGEEENEEGDNDEADVRKVVGLLDHEDDDDMRIQQSNVLTVLLVIIFLDQMDCIALGFTYTLRVKWKRNCLQDRNENYSSGAVAVNDD